MAITDIFKNRKIAIAYKNVFNTDDPEVKTVLRDMCAAHSVFDGGFDPEPYMHAFNAGERNVVLRIFTLLKTPLADILNLPEEEEE